MDSYNRTNKSRKVNKKFDGKYDTYQESLPEEWIERKSRSYITIVLSP